MDDRATAVADVAPPPKSLPRRLLTRLAGVSTWVVLGVGVALGTLTTYLGGPWWVAFLCYLLGGLLPLVLGTVPTGEGDTEFEVTNRERAVYLLSVCRWAFTPWGIFAQLLQIGGQVAAYARYRGKVPSTERHVPETDLRLPFDEEWTVVNGGVTEETSHSWELLAQRYAYDFVVTDAEGDTHAGDGAELDDYYAFGKAVRAPADGTVVAVNDRLRDYPRPGSLWLEWRTWNIAGNHVTVEHDAGEYSFLAHLQSGSTTVSEGDTVAAGEVVGRCGNSGHSTEPHLHYQLQDSASFWTAAGLPPRFAGVHLERDGETANDDEDRSSSDGTYLRAGDRVRSSK